MEKSSTANPDHAAPAEPPPDAVFLRAYFAAFAAAFLAAAGIFALLVAQLPFTWDDWTRDPAGVFRQIDPAVKLLGFALYLSLCCTFVPLPTGWIVAAVATRQAAVAAGVSENLFVVAIATTALVAAAGAVGSTVANLNDYHLFTWLLRHGRIARVRHTRTYQAAAKWFARSPFFLLVLFNIIPIPVDVIRMLATTYRYGRLPFAAANFVGRFVRYAVIAFVTFWWNLGWVAVIALLGVAVVLGASRVARFVVRRLRRPNGPAAQVSVGTSPTQEPRP